MGSDSDPNSDGRIGGTRGLILKAIVLIGGALLLKKFTKSTTRWDHTRIVAEALCGEKYSHEQASRNPDNYFNMSCPGLHFFIFLRVVPKMDDFHSGNFFSSLPCRTLTCPATIMADDSRLLYFEQAFWRTPQKPFRQRFYMVKPCSKEMKCDVEVSSYAIRDAEEYKNFCDRPNDQRPQAEEVIGDIAEHLTTVYLSRCERGKRCLYEGSTPPGGYPSSWNGATHCTSELAVLKNSELRTWDKGYDDEGNQVWGAKEGPYEFKPAPPSRRPDDMFTLLNFPPSISLEKKLEEPFVSQD